MIKVTFQCKAGHIKTVDMDIKHDDEVDSFVDNFVGYYVDRPEIQFIAKCKECRVADKSIQLGDDECMHIVKVCNLTKISSGRA